LASLYLRLESVQETAEPGVIEIFWANEIQVRGVPNITIVQLVWPLSSIKGDVVLELHVIEIGTVEAFIMMFGILLR
jgi:hypothetical protein